MKVLYLCPNFPPNYWLFPVRLREAGAEVAGIGWQAREGLRPEVRDALSEYRYVPDMNDRQAVLAAARELSSRAGGFDRVVSQEEHWIDLEAALRAELGVRGPKPDDIQPYRRKSLMKEVFRRAGVPVARGRVLDALSGALALAREAGFPLIAKPDQGVGAHATYKLEDEGELRGFFERGKPAVPYIFEEFLEGSIQSFDGLTDREGRVVFSACHQFGTDIMSVVNRDDHLHYWSMRELPKDLEEHGSKAIAAFGLRERFFHLEFIRGPQGRLTAMEVNARPPGGLTMDMFDYANDIDLFKEWANVLVRGRFEARFDRPYHVSYVGRKSNKRYAHSHEEVLERGGGMIVAHTPIDSVFRRAIGDYAYLARAKSLDELRPFVEFAQELAP